MTPKPGIPLNEPQSEALVRIRDNAYDTNDECRYCGNDIEEEHPEDCPAAIAVSALVRSAIEREARGIPLIPDVERYPAERRLLEDRLDDHPRPYMEAGDPLCKHSEISCLDCGIPMGGIPLIDVELRRVEAAVHTLLDRIDYVNGNDAREVVEEVEASLRDLVARLASESSPVEEGER